MISYRYSALENELTVMLAYLQDEEVMKRLAISLQQREALEQHKAAFVNIMQDYVNSDKRTSVVVKQIGKDYTVVYRWVSGFRKAVKYNAKEQLTVEDYGSLFIHQDKPRVRHKRPQTLPTLELQHIEPLNARIGAHHIGTYEKGNKPRLLHGIDMITWQWCIIDDRYPENPIYSQHKTTRTATLKLQFEDQQAGQFCHIIACYGINNGEVGAYCPKLTFAIT